MSGREADSFVQPASPSQLFSREQGGFVIALSLANAKVHVSTTIDQKFLVPGELYLPSCPVEKYWGRTVCHRALVTWGPRGSIDCKCACATLQSSDRG